MRFFMQSPRALNRQIWHEVYLQKLCLYSVHCTLPPKMFGLMIFCFIPIEIRYKLWGYVSYLITTVITLIRFGKFEEITVLMAKPCNFDSNISDFNSVDLKKAKK